MDHVFILTNGGSQNVNHKTFYFMPITHEILNNPEHSKQLHLFSAREVFERDFPRNYYLWKRLAMEWIGIHYQFMTSSSQKVHLIVVGDELDVELEAAKDFAKYKPNCLLKTLHFANVSNCSDQKNNAMGPINFNGLAGNINALRGQLVDLLQENKSNHYTY